MTGSVSYRAVSAWSESWKFLLFLHLDSDLDLRRVYRIWILLNTFAVIASHFNHRERF